jgi:hypothetical protein
MSVTFTLIPLALAYAAHRAAKEKAETEGHLTLGLQSRMKDPDLLARALADLGCEATVTAEGGLDVTRADGSPVRFLRDADETLDVHFADGTDPTEAETFLKDADSEYTRLVQEQVYQRLLERAAQLGLTVEGERVEADNSIVVTLRVDG